jgi:hypothetical protein
VQRGKALLPEKDWGTGVSPASKVPQDWGKQGVEKRLIKNLTKKRLGGQDDIQKIGAGLKPAPKMLEEPFIVPKLSQELLFESSPGSTSDSS